GGRESYVIDQQGVAVGVGAHHAAGADGAARAAGVLDRDLLAENFRHGLRGDARDRIGRPARGRGDDDVDRPRRSAPRWGQPWTQAPRRSAADASCFLPWACLVLMISAIIGPPIRSNPDGLGGLFAS